jgi:hypothetical protein
MMFTLWCKDVGQPDSTAWSEDYNEDVDDPQAWAEETLSRFNATLRKGERPRVLLRVEVKPNNKLLRHEWHKTNLVTIIKGRDVYDTYQCERCGMTAKRFGVGDITPDSKRDWRKSCKGAR